MTRITDQELFNRRSRIVIGEAGSSEAIELTNIEEPAQVRVAFKIETSLKPEPNTAEILIYNLNPDNRKKLETAEDLVASIEAGYVDNTFKIFAGELRSVVTTRDGPDIVTRVFSGDKEKPYREARINQSFEAGATTTAIISSLVRAMDVGQGNLADVILNLDLGDTGKKFRTGTVLSGLASLGLTEFCEAVGLEWSIQQGNVTFVQNGKAIGVLARTVNKESGLLGTPSVDGDGVLSAQMLMITDILPGRIINIESEFVEGRHRIEKASYSGDTRGADWFIAVEGNRLG